MTRARRCGDGAGRRPRRWDARRRSEAGDGAGVAEVRVRALPRSSSLRSPVGGRFGGGGEGEAWGRGLRGGGSVLSSSGAVRTMEGLLGRQQGAAGRKKSALGATDACALIALCIRTPHIASAFHGTQLCSAGYSGCSAPLCNPHNPAPTNHPATPPSKQATAATIARLSCSHLHPGLSASWTPQTRPAVGGGEGVGEVF